MNGALADQSSSCRGYPSRLATGSAQTWAFGFARSYRKRTRGRSRTGQSRLVAGHTRPRAPAEGRCRPYRRTRSGSRCVGARPEVSLRFVPRLPRHIVAFISVELTSLKNPAVSRKTHRFSSSSPFLLPSSSQLLFISDSRLSCSFNLSSSSSYAFCARGPTVVNGGMAFKGGMPSGGESLVICDWNSRSRRADSARFRKRGVKGRWNALTSGLSCA